MRQVVGVAILLFILISIPYAEEPGDDLQLPKGIKDISIGGVSFLSYRYGERSGDEYSRFFIYRGYLTVKKSLLPFLSSRITLDTSQDEDGDGEGDMEIRLKYAYAIYQLNDIWILTRPQIEFGVVHGPWLDFEEHINYYRMREKMFLERSHLFNSADFGVTVAGYIAGEMDEEYKKRVNKKYAGRYGSFALGVYNGGGYHAIERNQNKVFEGRLTIRPLPYLVPGMQLSGFTVYGEGNCEGWDNEIPDWKLIHTMLSYEHSCLTITGQYVQGAGNQDGDMFSESDSSKAREYRGFSFFIEGKLGPNWRVISGYDVFDMDAKRKEGDINYSYIGVGYDFGHHNILLFDYGVVENREDGKPDDYWYQVTMQIHY